MIVLMCVVLVCGLSHKTIASAPTISRTNGSRIDADITFERGENATLRCDGPEPLLWYHSIHKEAHSVPNESVISVDNRTPGSSTLQLDKAASPVGFYYCVSATNHIERTELADNDDVMPLMVAFLGRRTAVRVFVFLNETMTKSLVNHETISAIANTTALIPCVPLNKHVAVTIQKKDVSDTFQSVDASAYAIDPTRGALLNMSPVTVGEYKCVFNNRSLDEYDDDSSFGLKFADQSIPDKPEIRSDDGQYIAKNDQIHLVCKINSEVDGIWDLPSTSTAKSENRVRIVRKVVGIITLIVSNAQRSDSGKYECIARNKHYPLKTAKYSTQISVTAGPCHIVIYEANEIYRLELNISHPLSWVVNFEGRPKPLSVTWIDTAPSHHRPFNTSCNAATSLTTFSVRNVRLAHTGIYQLRVGMANGSCHSVRNFTLIVRSAPIVRLVQSSVIVPEGRSVVAECVVDGSPAANISWTWTECPLYLVHMDRPWSVIDCPTIAAQLRHNQTVKVVNATQQRSIVDLWPGGPGRLTCNAINTYSNVTQRKSVTVYVVTDDEKFDDQKILVARQEPLRLRCQVERYNYTDLQWLHNGRRSKGGKLRSTVSFQRLRYMLLLQLNVPQVSDADAGRYECMAIDFDGRQTRQRMLTVHVLKRVRPYFVDGDTSPSNVELLPNQQLDLGCAVGGMPVPVVQWLLNDQPLKRGPNVRIAGPEDGVGDGTARNHTLTVWRVSGAFDGQLRCEANSSAGQIERVFDVKVIGLVLWAKWTIGGLCGLVVLIVAVCSTIQISVIRKRAQMWNIPSIVDFHRGHATTTATANNYSIADPIGLPYDDRFELPLDRLRLSDEQLGSGHFGVVMKAHVRGDGTPVAVKMVRHKRNVDELEILMKELKVMIHMGQHVNVLQLVGAVTRQIRSGKLMVITEFCDRGGLQPYILKNAEGFVDQLNAETDQIDAGIGAVEKPLYINCAPPDVITTTDLVSWTYQVASGMAYLAARGVLHGDLAARNILLCSNGVVKICDFGLSRKLVPDEDYLKASRTALPFRWLAVESMIVPVFNTNTDIWSFGIFAWELFSLAARPYPDVPDDCLYGQLARGYRMAAPAYASRAIGHLIAECWAAEPTARPPFGELAARLGGWLPVEMLRALVEMNAPFERRNEATGRARSDYWTKVLPVVVEGIDEDGNDEGLAAVTSSGSTRQSVRSAKGGVEGNHTEETVPMMPMMTTTTTTRASCYVVGPEAERASSGSMCVEGDGDRCGEADADVAPQKRRATSSSRAAYLMSVRRPWSAKPKRTSLL